ncbi:hypothetical protein CNR22_16150 [Sphingobacteriaceae bacterium]|nr:hypothetical protein CNR22_16150 [Sphingobacteriaceae bacterium]
MQAVKSFVGTQNVNRAEAKSLHEQRVANYLKSVKMEIKKLSLAELKAKANAVTTAEALNAIKGGAQVKCHYPIIEPIKCELPTMKE